jgi:ABC-2 type transport system ATP-binding protein
MIAIDEQLRPKPTTDEAPEDKSSQFIIQTHELTKQFGEETAVDEINLAIPRGKIFGFIGPSGCGKTTTVRLLTGVYEPTTGEAVVLGRSPMEFGREEREKIGYMPQLFVLYPDLTVWENLTFVSSLYGVGLRRRRKRLRELLDLVELSGHENKIVRNISGGMQRRLSLAASLVHGPELLFLDEPTAGVDPVLRRKFWDHFRQLQEDGATLFVTTQYVNEAAYCDYVAVMAEGRLLVVDTPEGLRRRASGGDLIDVRLTNPLPDEALAQLEAQEFVISEVDFPDMLSLRVVVEDVSVDMPKLVQWFEQEGIEIESIREYSPPFDDVFVWLLEQENGNAE